MKQTRLLIDDGLAMRSVGGVGEYSRSLVQALRDNLTNPETSKTIKVTTSRTVPKIWGSQAIARLLYQFKLQVLSPLRYAVSNFDVVHFTNFYAPIWKLPSTKYVVTIHDLVGWENPSLVPVSPILFRAMRAMTEIGIKRSDAIVVTTPKTRDRIVELLGLDSEKVFVCPNIVKPMYELAQVTDRDQFRMIMVGTISRRKNVTTAIRSLAGLVDQFPDIKLIVIGAQGDAYEEVLTLVSSLGLEGQVEIRNGLNDSELLDLYKKSTLLVCPSHYEGFGIPIIEAMAAGLPVVASSIEVFKEVGGDATEYFGEPTDVEGLTRNIQNLLYDQDKRAKMSELGIAEAAKYSAANVVKSYHHIYETIQNS
jgi:glycosyltransferase involved in cell wall biosynthesis